MEDLARRLADEIEALEGALLTVTGAGISLASGIPTFRGSDSEAIWKQSDMELATFDYFRRDPVGQWRWYVERFRKVEGAEPNAAHRALAELERWQEGRRRRFLLVTQNIDTLHERAGSRSMVKVHGTSDRVRCSRTGCPNGAPAGSLPRQEFDFRPFVEDPRLEHIPRCPRCNSLLRAHVLFFDEFYQEHRDYQFQRVQEAADNAALVLFVGTSLSVGVTDLILQAARFRGVPAILVDPQPPPAGSGLLHLGAPAEELLPTVHARLAASSA